MLQAPLLGFVPALTDAVVLFYTRVFEMRLPPPLSLPCLRPAFVKPELLLQGTGMPLHSAQRQAATMLIVEEAHCLAAC